MEFVERAEIRRQQAMSALDEKSQSDQGQFFTPLAVAQMMAQMLPLPTSNKVRILDPGAGSGILTAAVVDRFTRESPETNLEIVAVEKDSELIPALKNTLKDCSRPGVHLEYVNQDFIEWALQGQSLFDYVIQNPPYFKIASKSEVAQILRSHGCNVPNMYAAFMSLGERLLKDGGYQVSITPRSWMNGTYYTAFRQDLLKESSIDSIHSFESRSSVFGESGVLQETVITGMYKGVAKSHVQLSVSHDHKGTVSTRSVPYTQVVTGDFIFVPNTDYDGEIIERMSHAKETLSSLNLNVSTGKVVGFRSREMLLENQLVGSLPLIHASHIFNGQVIHPLESCKKEQWVDGFHPNTAKNVISPGWYVLVKRFSAKEEKRRISAALYHSNNLFAIDNKVNYIHNNGSGLEKDVAIGIERWLNSAQVDDYFRIFSGHTQVNAGDLRQLPFPSISSLRKLAHSKQPTQDISEILSDNIESLQIKKEKAV